MNIQVVSRTQRIVVSPATQAISIINAGPPGPAGSGGSGGTIAGNISGGRADTVYGGATVISGGRADTSYGSAPVISGGRASG